jgi:dihydroflavonol-4-reductase
LLGAVNWSFADFFARVARLGKVEPPRLSLPTKLVSRAASFLERAYEFAGKTAPVDAASVEMADLFWYCDSTKAQEVLGFSPRDPQETLDETVRDVRRRML